MRRDRQQRPAGASGKRGKLIGWAGAGVVAIGAGLWGLHDHGSSGVPVVTADARPVRIRPLDPGGLNVNQTGNFVFSGDVDDRQARLAAPAEVPNTTALKASERVRVKAVKASGGHPPEVKLSDADG